MRLGTDIVEVGRIGDLMQRHTQFRTTVFSAREIAYCESRRRVYEHYAARFAVKESVMKALGRGWLQGIEWTDIELGRTDSGAPFIEAHGSAAAAMRGLGIDSFSVSVSHCKQYATAVVVALQGEEGKKH